MINFKKLVESAKRYPDDVLGTAQKRVDPETREVYTVRSGGTLRESLLANDIRANNLDLGALFAEVFGWHAFGACRSQGQLAGAAALALMHESRRLEEAAGGAVSSDVFLNITQQFAYSTVLAAYDIPSRIFVSKIPSRPSKFKMERVPGISHVGDGNQVVDEGKPFPEVGPSEDWIDTPETKKRGMIARATKEAVFFDQTGIFLERLGYLGEWLGVNDEKRAITCVVDAGETQTQQYRYRWRGNVINTYGLNSGNHTWTNLVTSNTLTTYANIQTAWQTLVQILDPFTGEPQNVDIRHICVPPALAFAVPFALKGMVKKQAPGYATSGNPIGTEIENPTQDIIGNIEILTSQLFRQISGSDTNWFIGDLSKAFEQLENWPLTVTTLGGGSQPDFDADIIFQTKVSKRSTFNTKQPRKMVQCTP